MDKRGRRVVHLERSHARRGPQSTLGVDGGLCSAWSGMD